MSAFTDKVTRKAAALRQSFRRQQRYYSFEDESGATWRHREVRDGNGIWVSDNTTLPVLANDPNYVAMWESVEPGVAADGKTFEWQTVVHTGPYPTPKALDYAIYASIGYVVLLVGVLIGAAA